MKLDDEEITEDTKKEKEISGLVKVEERLKGSVPWSFYLRFFTGPGSIKAVLMFVFITLAQMSRVFSDWWLGEWGSNSLDAPTNTYIIVYAGISLLTGGLIYLKGLFFAKFIISSSQVIQRKLIQALLKTPLNWFDVTPTGRIISRATKDQDDLDSSLSFNVQFSVQNLLTLFSSIVIISVATPVYLVVAFLSGLVYYKLIGLYMNSSREIKRLDALSRAPLIGHISETINGTYVIRAFNKTSNFIEQYYTKQTAYIVCIVNQNICNRWINIVTDLFSVVTIAATGMFGVLSVSMDLGQSSNNMVGLALVWALQINGIMSFTLRLLADTESNMNAVVRLYDYIDNNPTEKSFDQNLPRTENWPQEGNYQIKDVSYKYRPELPLVLKKLTFDISTNQKIGIVGRTGSGKSTMTLALLRIL
jgi:ABC-type multidrug transport system fused ATPase/permease subunit